MENNLTSAEELFYKLKDYADTRLELFKLKSINKVSEILTGFLVSVVLVVLLFLVLICITIGAALLLGAFLGKAYYGFFIIGLVYIIIGLVFYLGRNKYLKSPIKDKLTKEMLD